MNQAVVFFILFITPFIIAPFGMSQFETPKLIVSEVAILLLFISKIFFQKGENRKGNFNLLLFISLFVFTLFDLVFFKSQLSIFGNVFRLQGVFLLWFMMLFSYFSQDYSLKIISWVIYLGLLVAELLMMLILPLNDSGRYVGSMGEPNASAAFIIFLWPFAFFSIKKSGSIEKLGIILLFSIVGAVLILTHSRSAMVALSIQLIYIFLKKSNFFKEKAIFICIFIYLLSLFLPFFDKTIYESRSQVWQAAVHANNNYFAGNGFGNIETAIHLSAKKLDLEIKDLYVDSSHNLFLDWWVEGGLLGLTILFSFLTISFKKFIKENNEREIVLLLGTITVMSFNPASIITLLGFWWLLGQGLKSRGVDKSILS